MKPFAYLKPEDATRAALNAIDQIHDYPQLKQLNRYLIDKMRAVDSQRQARS